jgi:hypothetical protein
VVAFENTRSIASVDIGERIDGGLLKFYSGDGVQQQ